MFTRRNVLTLGIALAAALGFVRVADAGPTVPHRESCNGTLTKVIPPTATSLGIMEGSGIGVATYMGRYTFAGGHNFTNDGRILNGRFVNTAADGSTVSGTYSGTFTPVPGQPNVFQFNVRVLYLQGTGRHVGVTGVCDVVAIVNLGTGAFHYDTAGVWTLP